MDHVRLIGGPLDHDVIPWRGGRHMAFQLWAEMTTASYFTSPHEAEIEVEQVLYRRSGKTFAHHVPNL